MSAPPCVRRWLAEPLPRAVAQALDRLAAAPGVAHVAVMPDVHLAEHVCVGVVLGTTDVLYPQAVGGDIGCGMAAVRLDAGGDLLADESSAERLLAALRVEVPAVRQRAPRGELQALSDPALHHRVLRDARIEFGTLGRGNHFLELQLDEEERPWLMVHSGSRAVGPAVLAHHAALSEDAGKGLRALPAAGAGGNAYRHDAEVAVRYAAANRRAIAEGAERALAAALGVQLEWATWLECCHNFVRAEEHGGRALWVHRKGAASARDGEPGIVPGSMGSRSFHVAGRGCAEALCSSAHGAGRRLARGEAARTITVRQLEGELRGVFFDRGRAAALRDEAPSAYKDVGAVMRAQRDLVRVVRTLRPLLSYKGA